MDLFRGDYIEQPFKLSKDVWVAGGRVLFGAKLAVDDDVTDASAKMKHTFTDDDITESDADYVYFVLRLDADDTTVDPRTYIGEFQFVDADGHPTTFEQFPVVVSGDINRRVA